MEDKEKEHLRKKVEGLMNEVVRVPYIVSLKPIENLEIEICLIVDKDQICFSINEYEIYFWPNGLEDLLAYCTSAALHDFITHKCIC